MKSSENDSAGNYPHSGIEAHNTFSPSIVDAGSPVKIEDTFEKNSANVDPSALRSAQVEQLYHQASSGIYAAFIAACLLVLVFWSVVSHTLLIAWFACIATLYVVRQLFIVKFLKSKISGAEALQWEKPFAVLTAVSGLLWGFASVLFFPSSSPVYQAFLIIILAGLCNGVLIVYCTLKSVYLPFVLLGGLPLIGRFLYEQTPILLATGFIIAVYVTVLIVTGERMNAAYVRYIRLRFLKDHLIDFLGQEKKRVEGLYEALKQETAEKEKAVTALRKSESQYRELVEKANDIIFNADSSGHFTYINPASARILDFTAEELIGKHYLELIHPQYKEIVERHYGIQFVKKTPDTYFEVPIVSKGGRTVWLGQFVHLSVQGDTVTGFHAIGRDITDRKQAEKALKESEERLELALKGADLGLWDYDFETGQTFISERRAEIVGYSRDELGSDIRSLGKLIHPDDLAGVTNALNSHLQGRSPMYESEHRLLHKSGCYIWILARGKVVEWDKQGKPVRMVGTTLDITDRKKAEAALQSARNELESRVEQRTAELRDANEQLRQQIAERKQAEEALRDSEERLRAVVYGCPIPQFVIDHDKKVIYWNRALEEISGIRAEEVVGTKEQWKAFYAEERQGLANLLVDGDLEGIDDWYGGKCGKSKVSANAYEATDFFPAMSNEGKWLYFSATVIRDSKGQVMGAVETLEDITDRKRAEQALRESEEKYRALFEESRDALYITTRDGKLVDANQAFLDLFGLSRDESKDMNVLQLYIDPADRKRFQDDIEQNGPLHEHEIRYQKKDRTVVECVHSSSLRLDKDGTILGYQGTIRDVTDHKQLQRQLLQAQKMEAVGILAGGIAHDFNNLLQVTVGYSEVLMSRKDKADPEYAHLREILQAGRSGAELVQRLLTLGRKKKSKQRPIDLNHQIEQIRRLLTRTIPKMIKIELRLSDPLATVNADPTQIGQIIMNLAVNARDAMPEGGKLTLSTENVILDENYCRVNPGAKPGSYVLLAISDTGSGMDKEIVDHVFEPFYTTKAVGKGTGLGLAVVYGIVKQHGGEVTCESQPGYGAVFKVYLPAIEQQEVVADEIAEEPKPLGGTETILLVDDEDAVRDLGKLILDEAGYKVITAHNGREALEIYRNEQARISLVIMDLLMPEMGGKQCMQELVEINPSVRVLVASGYASGGTARDAVEHGAKAFVNKPFNAAQLLQQVRAVLDLET